MVVVDEDDVRFLDVDNFRQEDLSDEDILMLDVYDTVRLCWMYIIYDTVRLCWIYIILQDCVHITYCMLYYLFQRII